MFKQVFTEQLAAFTTDQLVIDQYWAEVEYSYYQPNRFYHNLVHLDNLISHLLVVRDSITDWSTLVFSVAYHDIVYDVLKSDNEEKSAAFANERLKDLSVSSGLRQKCIAQILATKDHAISADGDTNYLTDADLAILGADENEFNQYSIMIRKEYSSYAEPEFNAGRKKALRYFLQMPRIYKTAHFYDLFEDKARRNLEKEYKTLIGENFQGSN